MTPENPESGPYATVLADLRAQREKIDNAIRVVEQLSGLKLAPGPDGDLQFVPKAGGGPIIEETAGMFLGMSIVDATKKLLGLRKRTMGNVDIARELQEGGLKFTGTDPVNVVGSVLTRRFNNVGDVVKVGRGIWGLKEWYPGRTFKTGGRSTVITTGTNEAGETVTTASTIEPGSSEGAGEVPDEGAELLA